VHKRRSESLDALPYLSTTMVANNNAETSNKRGGSIIISVAGDEYETELVEDKNPFAVDELHTKKKVSKLQALAMSRKKKKKVSATPPAFKPLVTTSKQPAPNRGHKTHNPFDEEVPFDEGDQDQHDKACLNPFDDDKRDSSGDDKKNSGGINPFDDDIPLAKQKNPFDDDLI
jgi:hypothetical protein